MADFIELHNFNSGKRISVNIDTISQIGELASEFITSHGVIIRVDGGSIEVREDYDQIVTAIAVAETVLQMPAAATAKGKDKSKSNSN